MTGERKLEKEFQEKLADLQVKTEQALREREAEVRDELDGKTKSSKQRYNTELQKAHDMIKQRESEIDTIERQNVELAQEKSQIEAAL